MYGQYTWEFGIISVLILFILCFAHFGLDRYSAYFIICELKSNDESLFSKNDSEQNFGFIYYCSIYLYKPYVSFSILSAHKKQFTSVFIFRKQRIIACRDFFIVCLFRSIFFLIYKIQTGPLNFELIFNLSKWRSLYSKIKLQFIEY